MNIWDLVDKVKSFIVYDANTEFYAKIFPDTVTRKDLMHLRKMRIEDLSHIIKIETENYYFPWSEGIFTDCLKSDHYSCWVCLELKTIVGYSVISIVAGEAHIMNLCVDSEAQNLGVGSLLLEKMIALARKKVESIFLEVRPSNQIAIALYKKRGFNEIGIRKNYYPARRGGKEDAVMLALDLVSLF